MIGGSQHKGVSFRECDQADSLHIVLVNPGASKEKCGVHLDSVSVAKPRRLDSRPAGGTSSGANIALSG